MIVASVEFKFHEDGRFATFLWGDEDATDPGTESTRAIERLVRVCMRAQGAHRVAIEAAVNAAEKEQKEPAQ